MNLSSLETGKRNPENSDNVKGKSPSQTKTEGAWDEFELELKMGGNGKKMGETFRARIPYAPKLQRGVASGEISPALARLSSLLPQKAQREAFWKKYMENGKAKEVFLDNDNRQVEKMLKVVESLFAGDPIKTAEFEHWLIQIQKRENVTIPPPKIPQLPTTKLPSQYPEKPAQLQQASSASGGEKHTPQELNKRLIDTGCSLCRKEEIFSLATPVKEIMLALLEEFPKAKITSATRPQSTTGDHPKGLAFDADLPTTQQLKEMEAFINKHFPGNYTLVHGVEKKKVGKGMHLHFSYRSNKQILNAPHYTQNSMKNNPQMADNWLISKGFLHANAYNVEKIA